ncbi:MAG: HIT domain-containing protein [Sulfolobales archaeon]
MKDENCVFCRIFEGVEEGWIVYEDKDLVVFLDKYPLSYGHLLIAPRDHYKDVVETPPDIVARIFIVARGFGHASVRYLGATGFRIITNKGSSAGQVIFHFHVHVIPRYGFGSPGSIQPREILKEETARRIVEAYRRALEDEDIRNMIIGRI